MINNDKYKSGFEQAIKDAKAGKKRNILSAKEAFKAIFSWNSNTYMDTYISGYKEGYREYEKEQLKSNFREENKTSKKEEKTINKNSSSNYKSTSNTKNTNNMSGNQSIYLQLQQLEELTHFLDSFKDMIQAKMVNYQHKVDNIYSNGLPVEVYNKFQSEHIDETHALVSQIVNLIESSSIPFVQQNIQRYTELLNYNQ